MHFYRHRSDERLEVLSAISCVFVGIKTYKRLKFFYTLLKTISCLAITSNGTVSAVFMRTIHQLFTDTNKIILAP